MSQEVKKNEKFLYHQPETLSRSLTRGGRFRTFPFSDTKWSFTRASNYRALTGKNVVFWIGSALWQVVAYGRWSHMDP